MPFIPLSEEKPKGFTPIAAEPPAPPVNRAAAIDASLQRGVDSVGRQIGLTTRAAVQGFPLLSVPNMIGDAAGLQSSKALSDAMTKLGLPEPKGAVERVAQDMASGMSGAAGVAKGGELAAKGGTALVKKIGETLAARPGTQVVAGATGPGAAGIVREEGGSPLAQGAAGVAGSFVPALPAAAAAATRGLIRGGEVGRQKMLTNIDTFEDAGAGTPTVGQATETRGNRAIESVLSKAPGGAGPMAKKAEAEAAGLGSKIDDMATNLSGRTGAAPAGRQIASGIKEFTNEFKKQSGKLYDDLDRFILPDTQVSVGNTSKTLGELTAITPGAEKTSATMINPKITEWKDAIATDAKNGMLPYGAVKDLRSKVGAMLNSGELVSEAPRAQLKQLYGALTADMEAAAQKAGPDATLSLKRANNYYRSGMKRIDGVLEPIINKGDPEDIFRAATSGTKEGATTIAGVMKSLPADSRKVVAATMLRRMGLATPGKQNELGEAFSTETFLTNWNKLHPDAKRVLFAPLPDTMRGDLDKIAKVASNMREGSKVFANPSGTGQANASNLTAGAFILSLLTGQPGAAAGIAGATGASYLGANALTSPKIVHWLAESTKMPVEQLPAQLNNLFQQSLYMKADERRETRAFVKDVRAQLPGKGPATSPAGPAVQ